MEAETKLRNANIRLAELTQKIQHVENERNLIRRVAERVSVGFEEAVILTGRMPAIFDEILASKQPDRRKKEMIRLHQFFRRMESDFNSLLNGNIIEAGRPLLLEKMDALEKENAELKKSLKKKVSKNENSGSNPSKKRKQGDTKQKHKKDSGKAANKVDNSGS